MLIWSPGWKIHGIYADRERIEANLEKYQVVINMRSLITALSRFLSRSAEAALPIFHNLKKNEKFSWIIKSEEAFQKMKAMLATPPILTRPTPGKPLLVYLSISNDVASAAIVQEGREPIASLLRKQSPTGPREKVSKN
ncbi:hypothetical protein CR513_12311, partial [Mucuna pruriens]